MFDDKMIIIVLGINSALENKTNLCEVKTNLCEVKTKLCEVNTTANVNCICNIMN